MTVFLQVPEDFEQRLRVVLQAVGLRPYFSCLATEFRTVRIAWDELVADDEAHWTEALRLDVYVWPMIAEYRQGAQKLLVRVPLAVSAQ
jgi:hypothetical protein